jgi:hypothetical protein
MADLSTMFNQLGPAGGSILAGVQMGNEANAAQSEQAMRKAQMDKILMDMDQAKLMNPLELQAKQQALDAGKLKAQQEKDAYRDEVLGKAIPTLANISGPARYAAVDQIFAQAGLPLDDADRKHLFSMDPDAMLKELKAKHEWSVTQNKAYRQAMDVEEVKRKSAEKIASGHDAATRYTADQRANAAAAKKQGIASIQENVRSGKMTAEKAAVALFGAAQFETDPDTKRQYEDMARQYEQFAMNQRNAANQGRVDVGAAANLPTQTLSPALGAPGAGPAPTANPNRRPISQY